MAKIDLTMNKELLSHEALAMTLPYTHLASSHNFSLSNIRPASHSQAITLVECVRDIGMFSELLELTSANRAMPDWKPWDIILFRVWDRQIHEESHTI